MPSLEPPGLPPRLIDHAEDIAGNTPLSTWDALANAVLVACHVGGRRRVRWLRWSLLHWCCRRPMRIACVDYQPKHLTFGWTRDWERFAACNRCGRIKDCVTIPL
jgi:hypothetical protein